jgi:hypothetical protein
MNVMSKNKAGGLKGLKIAVARVALRKHYPAGVCAGLDLDSVRKE